MGLGISFSSSFIFDIEIVKSKYFDEKSLCIRENFEYSCHFHFPKYLETQKNWRLKRKLKASLKVSCRFVEFTYQLPSCNSFHSIRYVSFEQFFEIREYPSNLPFFNT